MRHIVQQLAAQGRNGDDTLIHVSQPELGGLAALAKAGGRQLTRNPVTGLPEAFGLMDILSVVAPVVAGIYGGPTAGMAAGAAMGAATNKQSPLMGAIAGGVGGYGGGNLGTSLADAGAGAAANQVATSGATDAATYGAADASAPAAREAGIAAANSATSPAVSSSLASSPDYISNVNSGAQQYWNDPSSVNVTSKGLSSIGMPIGASVMMNPRIANPSPTGSSNANSYNPKGGLFWDNRTPIHGAPNGIQRSYVVGQFTPPGMAAGGLTSLASVSQPAYGQAPDPFQGPMVGGRPPDGQGISPIGQYMAQQNRAPIPTQIASPILTTPTTGGSSQQLSNYLAPHQTDATQAPVVYNPPQQHYVPPPPDVYGNGLPLNVNMVDAWGGGGNAGVGGGGSAGGGSGIGGSVGGSVGGSASGGGAGTGYADGGLTSVGQYLQGAGDGMSDHIPAQVGGPGGQQIRVANNEYVVPADVVSHLGNGSSDAGAKVLDQMGVRVRAARTGNPKQGKRIDPSKFTPG